VVGSSIQFTSNILILFYRSPNCVSCSAGFNHLSQKRVLKAGDVNDDMLTVEIGKLKTDMAKNIGQSVVGKIEQLLDYVYSACEC
jgi:hypothetical protein